MVVFVRNGTCQSPLAHNEPPDLHGKNAEAVPGGASGGGGIPAPLMFDSISGQVYLFPE